MAEGKLKIYLIPGLGFDDRIFSKLNLTSYNPTYLNWIEPLENESIQQYAHRFSDSIDDSDKTVLIGHSLGGIISQEIAAFKNIDLIILLSSIRSRDEMPFFFKIIQPLYLHKLFTKQLTFKTFPFWAKQHDYETEEEQALFKSMVGKQSNQYLQWALKELSKWQTPQLLPNTKVIQIVGKKDKTFPIRNIKSPDVMVEDGGHFMTFKKPKLISKYIVEENQLIINQ